MVVKSPAGVLAFGTFLVLCALVGTCYGGDLKLNFYEYGYNKCPSAKDSVNRIVTQNVKANPGLAAKLLRLHFHDCFVRGCDASILLDSTSSNQAEKDAVPNLSLGGFDVINEIKAEIEQNCAGVVSCADIVALAARDAVAALNPYAWWDVKTGRRDGTVSIASEALTNLPSPFADFETLKRNFASKNLNVVDLVTLSGAHTIGVTRCIVISSRLYNFNGVAGASDPSLNPLYVPTLKQLCPKSGNPFTEVNMDPNSAVSFDSHYFTSVKNNTGIFVSDAALLSNSASRGLVNVLQNQLVFFQLFGISMQRMGSIGVLTGTKGQIRTACNVVN